MCTFTVIAVVFFLLTSIVFANSKSSSLCANRLNNINDDTEIDEHDIECICSVMECVYKCCPFGYQMQNKTCVEATEDRNEDLYEFVKSQLGLSRLYIIHRPMDCFNDDITRFIINAGPGGIHKVIIPSIQGLEDNLGDFCVDYFVEEVRFAAIVCAEMQSNINMQTTGMIISMPFLVATFLVYALLPDRNLPAKALMCYVLSLLFAYIMLVTIQLDANLPPGACNTIAFLCYFFFMASFFWMNSSCIDIWLTFSGIKGMTGQRTQERKRFVYYCLYSWGLPLVMTGIVIFCTYYLSNSENPAGTGIGHGQCWFQNGLPTGIYFYFPIAALLITNITLFVVTALKIRNVQRDTKMLNEKDSSKHEKDKQRDDVYSDQAFLTDAVKNRGFETYDFLDEDNSCTGFNLYVKLLFAMGINWSMEVISWAVQWKLNNIPAWIWYITDFCNAMYGVLIFFIFVFKRNIWLMLKKRYLQFMGRPTQAHSMGTSTHRTTVSQVTSSEA